MDYKTPEEITAELSQKVVLESLSKAVGEREEITVADNRQEDAPKTDGFLLAVCVVCALSVLGMAVSMTLILCGRKRHRRRRRR